MSPKKLTDAYLFKSQTRIGAIEYLLNAKNYSDVVRECQETVELCSKAILRLANIDPPHKHDVSQELKSCCGSFDPSSHSEIYNLALANQWLRREREISFYGAEDFDPVDGYTIDDANRALACAKAAVKLLEALVATK